MSSNPLKNLKSYAKRGDEPVSYNEISENLKDETDRAAVIILSALLEDNLERALRRKVDSSKDSNELTRLFEFYGPLGTFSSRIEVAHAFGVIEEDTKVQLHLMREMRNACAHSHRPISFAIPELEKVVEVMTRGDKSFCALSGKKLGKDRRQALILEVVMLATALKRGSRAKAVERLQIVLKDREARGASIPIAED